MLVDVCTLAFSFWLGIRWLLQVAVYPTYRLVGKAEFVPFHVAQGQRMIPVMIVPMFGSSVLVIDTGVLSRNDANASLLWGVVRDNLPRSLAWTVGAVLLVLAHRSAP